MNGRPISKGEESKELKESKELLNEALTEATRIILYNEATRIMLASGVKHFGITDAGSFRGDINFDYDSPEYEAILEKSKVPGPRGAAGIAIPTDGFAVLKGLRENKLILAVAREEKARLMVNYCDEMIREIKIGINNLKETSKAKRRESKIADNSAKAILLSEAIEYEVMRINLDQDLRKKIQQKEEWQQKLIETQEQIAHLRAGGKSKATIDARSAEEKITLDRILECAKSVAEAKAGACHSLAAFALMHLMNELSIRPCPTIQLVAHCGDYTDTHTFLLIGHNSPDVSYPALEANKNAFIIVDPWLAGLGHGNGVFTFDDHPRKKYLQNLKCIYNNSPELTVVSASRPT